ncbi:hypothetical protein PoB_004476300 [Plakobranchus ocellatus]|uniref:Uncharacterized protein n=1 Tax=Plakobranchus ocellatus TaxID=259542 RepID=A0AAV4BGH8_9GAST|nr:hypothetical protein PoB_004476300 [Plakobranchus ocellatus]
MFFYSTVEVSSRAGFVETRFTLATTGNCGVGSVLFSPDKFQLMRSQNPDCPDLILIAKSKSGTMMNSVDLTWIPPLCGCVQFRALVFVDGKTFVRDWAGVSNGNLTTTVCVHLQTSQLEPLTKRKKRIRDLYGEALCQVRNRYSSMEIIQNESFRKRHDLLPEFMDSEAIVAALERRRAEADHCCKMDDLIYRSECLDNVMKSRVDELCSKGLPDIPFTTLRKRHMIDRKEFCCTKYNPSGCVQHFQRLPYFSPGATQLDFSMNELDPINDLADWATLEKDQDVLQMLTVLKFGVEMEPKEIIMEYEKIIPGIPLKQIFAEERLGPSSKKMLFFSDHCFDELKPHSQIIKHSDQSSKRNFRLDVKPKRRLNHTRQSYSVEIRSIRSLSEFKIILAAHTLDNCGIGTFKFQERDYKAQTGSASHCPQLSLTSRFGSRQKTPALTWTPPFCGCVHFRVLVFEEGYAGKLSGNLTKTACISLEVSLPDLANMRGRGEGN